MYRLSCFSLFPSENPGHRIFHEENSEGSFIRGVDAKKVGDWVIEGKSTEQAKKLAEQVNAQIEDIKNGTNKELVKLYVDVFFADVPTRENLNVVETKVDSRYDKKGTLEVLEMNSPFLKNGPFKSTDLKLLAYGNIFKEMQAKGMDANYLPKGSVVKMENGKVTVTYPNGKTASADLFPWDTYEVAKTKYAEIVAEEAARAGKEAEARRAAGEEEAIDLGDEPATVPPPPVPEPSTVPSPVFSPEPKDEGLEDEKAEIDSLEADWARIEEDFTRVEQAHPEIEIFVRDPRAPVRTEGSKIVEVKNKVTKQEITIEVNLPLVKNKRPKTYNGEHVRIERVEHNSVYKKGGWFHEDVRRPASEGIRVEEAVRNAAAELQFPEGFLPKLQDINKLSQLPVDRQVHYLSEVTDSALKHLDGLPEVETKKDEKRREKEIKNLIILYKELVKWHFERSKTLDETSDPALADKLSEVGTKIITLKTKLKEVETEAAPDAGALLGIPEGLNGLTLSMDNFAFPQTLDAQLDTFLRKYPDLVEIKGTRRLIRPDLNGYSSFYVEFETKGHDAFIVKVNAEPIDPLLVKAYMDAHGDSVGVLGQSQEEAIRTYASYTALSKAINADLDAKKPAVERAIAKWKRKTEKPLGKKDQKEILEGSSNP